MMQERQTRFGFCSLGGFVASIFVFSDFELIGHEELCSENSILHGYIDCLCLLAVLQCHPLCHTIRFDPVKYYKKTGCAKHTTRNTTQTNATTAKITTAQLTKRHMKQERAPSLVKPSTNHGRKVLWQDGMRSQRNRNRDLLEEVRVFVKNTPAATTEGEGDVTPTGNEGQKKSIRRRKFC